MSRALLILAAVVLTSSCHHGPRAPRFAIELQVPDAPPARVVVNEEAGSDSQFPLASLPPLGTASQSLAGWETLDLNYSMEGNKVKVGVFALHQEYDPRRHSMIFRSQKLGAHTASLRESVSLGELEKYGFRPLTLRVVPLK